MREYKREFRGRRFRSEERARAMNGARNNKTVVDIMRWWKVQFKVSWPSFFVNRKYGQCLFFWPRVASQSQSYEWLFAFSWFFGRKVALVVLKLSAEKWCWDCCSAIILIAVLDLKSIFSLVFLWMSWRQQQIVALVTCFSSSLWIFYDTLRCWKVVLCEKWPTFFRTW